jgi:hypothetical protein
MKWYAVHEVQIPGKKIEPKRPLLDTLIPAFAGMTQVKQVPVLKTLFLLGQ